MPNFTKIKAYNRYDSSTLVVIYLNINHIVSLSEIVDSKQTWYTVNLIDASYTIPKVSYDYLARLLYGKDSENNDNFYVNTLINNLVDEIADFVGGYTCTKSLELAEEINKKFKVEEIKANGN